MKILLVKQPGEDLTAYHAVLQKRGVDYEELVQPITGAVLNSDDAKRLWCETIYKQYGEKIDGVQFFLLLSDWPERRSLLGRMFNRQFSGYLTSCTRMRRGYEKTAEHELLHKVDNWVKIYLGISIERILGVSDWDDVVVHGDVEGDAYTEYNYDLAWKQIQPYLNEALIKRRHVALLGYFEQLIIMLRAKLLELEKQAYTVNRLLHPFEEYPLSQKYGISNSDWYPLTGHHIGTDYATPSGTPIRAMTDGRVVQAGFTKSLGYFCIFEYQHKGKTFQARFMHLLSLPAETKRAEGEIIGYTGVTGFVTGPSVHLDIWPEAVRVNLINGSNWQQLTVDPEEHLA